MLFYASPEANCYLKMIGGGSQGSLLDVFKGFDKLAEG